MAIFGYLTLIAGAILLYDNSISIGLLLVFFGGFLSGNLKISMSSLGVMIIVGGSAYGFHNEFTDSIILTIVIGFILSGIGGRNSVWEIEVGDVFSDSSGDGGD